MYATRRSMAMLWITLASFGGWWIATGPCYAQTPSWTVSATQSPNTLASSLKIWQPTPSASLFSPSYDKMARLGMLGISPGSRWGSMHQHIQAGDPWFWSSYLSAPFFAGGVVLLIANLAILFDNYSPEVYLGWGVTGVVWGVLGTTAAIVSMILDLSNVRGGTSPDPGPNIIAFNVIHVALQLSVLGLGITSIIRSRRKSDPAVLSWTPWIKPERDGHVQVGLQLQGTF